MKVLLWHVHGSWTTSFVQGAHDYLLPVTPDRGPDGLGRARTWAWPASAREVTPDQLRGEDVDVVVLQRTRDLELVREWLGREPGRDLPAVFLEHNAPDGAVPNTRHPLADQREIPIAHVTFFNQLFYDNGSAPTTVIEHGIVDPGERYTGELACAGVVVNEPVRRGRYTGGDLLPLLSAAAPLDVFGMGLAGLHERYGLDPDRVGLYDDPPQAAMHDELARRRVYVHPVRWTSLGLSLLEAMHLGMPVVGLATTEAVEAVPPDAGVLSTRPERLAEAVRHFVAEPDAARLAGKAARAAALERYGLDRFLADWDALLAEVTR
ncbi:MULTISPECIES: glycosyltransferase [unclassified Modestobacter]|uniref:glycosyltransferase n=1 Tax=unclassified Modestobacter TaxID=2643866 RepID=UPI0022AA09C7|nr:MULTISPECIES: glycosyltransferase [unclassified Modestobacter]MCZ2825531.1 glycosyltransferase [Modestobacter sp. VKM Ac-2981]MCZ2853404.1 glycosyltransferase [Modestobacter sp. VKM Ac-2982]